MGFGGGAGFFSVFGVYDTFHVAYRELGPTHFYQGSHDDADHVAEKTVRAYHDAELWPAFADQDGMDVPDRVLSFVWVITEGAKIVFTEQIL